MLSNPNFSEISTIIDCEHKNPPFEEDGFPYIRTSNVERGRIVLEYAKRVSPESYKEWTRRAIPKSGDIVLTRDPPIGNAGIVEDGMNLCLGQGTVLIRPDKSIVDSEFLTYLILGDEVQAIFRALASGATLPHLNLTDLRKIRLPWFPQLPIQRKVGAILSAYDNLIENNRRRMEVLEEMARAIYREWFVHFRFLGYENIETVDSEHGEIPEGWKIGQLGDIAEEVRRNTKPSDLPPDTPYVGLAEIPRRSIALYEWGKASDAGSSKLQFKKGEILFGKIRPYFHKVVVAPVDGICSGDIIVIVPRTSDMLALTLSVVNSDYFVAHATASSKGTKMPRADWEVLVNYPIIIPESSILKKFNLFIENSLDLIQTLIFLNRSLQKARDLLLPRLVSGKIDVSNLTIDVSS